MKKHRCEPGLCGVRQLPGAPAELRQSSSSAGTGSCGLSGEAVWNSPGCFLLDGSAGVQIRQRCVPTHYTALRLTPLPCKHWLCHRREFQTFPLRTDRARTTQMCQYAVSQELHKNQNSKKGKSPYAKGSREWGPAALVEGQGMLSGERMRLRTGLQAPGFSCACCLSPCGMGV